VVAGDLARLDRHERELRDRELGGECDQLLAVVAPASSATGSS
jgi:hypothetical protein